MKNKFIFIFVSVVLLGCTKEDKKTIVCWGDSLTMQHKDYGIRGNIKKWMSGNFIDDSYPGFLGEMLGEGYEVVNCGVGGENTLTIAARQGSIPMFIDKDIIFEAGENEVPIENDILRSSWDSSVVAPLHQSKWNEGSPARINPCKMNQSEMLLKCKRINDGEEILFKYSLKRTECDKERIKVMRGTIIATEASLHLRKPHVNIFFVGQNGGYKDISDYVAQLTQMVEYGKSDKYIVISFHKPNHVIKNVEAMQALEDSLYSAFKEHYINLRSYMVSLGLKDAALAPTNEDNDSIRNGQVPPQLMTDGTHFNAIGCKLIANVVKAKMKELRY